MQCTPMLIISNAVHNYAYHKQLNFNALHNYAYHKEFNSNALHNYAYISKLNLMHCTIMLTISNAMHSNTYNKHCSAQQCLS